MSDPAKAVSYLSLRKTFPPERVEDRFELLKGVNESMPDLQKALNDYGPVLRQGWCYRARRATPTIWRRASAMPSGTVTRLGRACSWRAA